MDALLPSDLFEEPSNAEKVGACWSTVTDEDWTCAACGMEKVFASRMSCFRCGAARPGRAPGSSERRPRDDYQHRRDDDRRHDDRHGDWRGRRHDDQRHYEEHRGREDRRSEFDRSRERFGVGRRLHQPSKPQPRDPLAFERRPGWTAHDERPRPRRRDGRSGPGFVPNKPPPECRNKVPYKERSFAAQAAAGDPFALKVEREKAAKEEEAGRRNQESKL
mmetsp:Transcript_43426/g.141273  ORF Transcript_43426/g.141273 Transcript_43426/m.141273 type:complete len:220 (+) Transcript_43426:150-809(+)